MSDSDDLRIAGEGKLNGQEALAGHGQLLDGEHQNPVVIEEGLESVGAERPLPFLSVAVAASADSAEAYTELFRSLPPDTGMSFVVIPHAVSGRTDDFVDRLVRQTAMPVSEIVEGTALQPDHVYVVPPNRLARLRGGKFHLSGLDSDAADHLAPRQPIDHFFRSLASDQKTRSIGVLLSGSDGGGALGLKAIQGEGGITFVQSPESAPFSEMPRSSISVDDVDKVLPPSQIASELTQLARQFAQPALRTLEEGAAQQGQELHYFRILNLLRAVSGVDFRLYKPTTIRRRIARRMLLQGIPALSEYASYLQANPKELRDLQEDALINVTQFFRDPSVFENLKQKILPRILENRDPEQQVRIWVAGCATGEETYSIAICLLEYLTGKPFEPSIQIFGTDASDSDLAKARAGIFPESIVEEVSPERLRRFFIKVDRGYQVTKRVRDLCIFARQNLCHDPPFSKMDLISCRNVLIYFGSELQKQVLPTFHYALRPNGYLLLGTTETIREFAGLFQLVDRKNKIFARVGESPTRAVPVAPRLALPEVQPARIPPTGGESWGDLELQRTADRIVLARYGPPGVVVDEKLEILQSRGHTGPFIEMPQGAVSLHLARMLRDNLAAQVTKAVNYAVEHDVPVQLDGLRILQDGQQREFALEVLPIHTMAPRSRCFLVLFVPPKQAKNGGSFESIEPSGAGSVEQDQTVERLRQDLASARLYLETLLEERDTRNQELIAANEEIQSANEEMRSTNEELETTKEELQSSNEELQTVNDELQQRNAILTQTSNDLSNLLNSVHLPVLMLNNEFQIRHFTPPTQRLMNLRASDIGRPVSEIRLNLQLEDMSPMLRDVMETLTPRETEVRDREGRWHLLRVRPYRTTDNKIEGLVVVLLDIDQLRRSQHDLRAARDFARSIIEAVPLPLAVVDMEFKIRSVNEAFCKLVGTARETLEQRPFPDVIALAAFSLEPLLRSRLEMLRVSDEGDFQFEFKVPDSSRCLNITGRVLKPDGEKFLLVTFEDITVHKEVERLLSQERESLASEVESTARELGRTQNELRALTANLFTSSEDERRRVARELHDDISQKLASLEMGMERLEPQIDDAHQAGRQLRQVRTAIGNLAEDVRRISHALHPSVLDDLGLVPAIRSLVDDFLQRDGMISTFSAADLPDGIPTPIATGLYRITQEALRNVAKHAGKTHVKVTLKGTSTSIQLQVVDSGDGFDMEARRPGLGLISMEERARMIGATFHVQSELGEGTRITVDVPWRH